MNWFDVLQVETVREKRRREVEFSKAGLELPETDQPFTKKKRDNASQNIEVEVNEDNTCSPAFNPNAKTNVQSSDNGFVTVGRSGDSVKEGANDTVQQSIPELPQKCTQSTQIEEIVDKHMVSNYSVTASVFHV